MTLNFPRVAQSYPIIMGKDLLKYITKWLPKGISHVVVVTDNLVKKYYLSQLLQNLKNRPYSVLLLTFPSGEKFKTVRTKSMLEKKMLKNHCGRDTVILALGGGVVGDLAGFIAATYMRGIPYIQIPTTYLSMVDSSVGGKTGVDLEEGKNLIGAIWQPYAVIIDTQCLSTLPKKHRINGLFETLKIFLTCSLRDFSYFRCHFMDIKKGEKIILEKLIKRSIKIKATIVQQDENELNERKILNFGHTIGHALERESHYKLLHGFAVGYGILVESKISEVLGFLSSKDYLTIQSILSSLGIKAHHLAIYNIKNIIQWTKIDKKARANSVNYVLLKRIGQVYQKQNSYVHAVTDKTVANAFCAILGN